MFIMKSDFRVTLSEASGNRMIKYMAAKTDSHGADFIQRRWVGGGGDQRDVSESTLLEPVVNFSCLGT